MEIEPGVGLPVARVGWSVADVEALVGPPSTREEHRVFWHDHVPGFVVHLDDAGRIELVEAYHGEPGEEQLTLGEVRLTHRLMDDVVADLARAGLEGRSIDVGYEYEAGFCLVSMASLTPSDLDPDAAPGPDDERLVVEGVSVAPIAYWRDA